jgi:hypothetical protein
MAGVLEERNSAIPYTSDNYRSDSEGSKPPAKNHNFSTTQSQAKGLISWPSAKRTKDLLKLKRPIKMGGRTTYWTLPPKRTPFPNGVDRWPNL